MLRGLLRQAIEAAEADERPLGTRVHQMRAALKKARALLKLVRPLLDRRAREERRRLAAIARWVGVVRDAGVVVETLDRLTGTSRNPTSSMPALRRHLVARRRGLEEDPQTAKALCRASLALRLARRRAKGLLRRGHGRRALADGFARGYRKARRAMKKAYRRDTPEAFHAWRKAVKTHAFHVKVLAGAAVGGSQTRSDLLEALGAALGEAHDLGLLEDALLAERTGLGKLRAYERVVGLVRTRQLDIHRDVCPIAWRLFADRPSTMHPAVVERRGSASLLNNAMAATTHSSSSASAERASRIHVCSRGRRRSNGG